MTKICNIVFFKSTCVIRVPSRATGWRLGPNEVAGREDRVGGWTGLVVAGVGWGGVRSGRGWRDERQVTRGVWEAKAALATPIMGRLARRFTYTGSIHRHVNGQ